MPNESSYAAYWRVYGGFTSLVRSTYFWAALFLTAVFPRAREARDAGKPIWADLTMQISPSLLGFALGGMAIMLAFSSGKFLEAIRQKGKDNSYFRKVIASFFHFSVVLTLSLVSAFMSRFYDNPYLSFAGVFLTLYGIMLILSIVSRIWQTALIFNKVREYDNPA